MRAPTAGVSGRRPRARDSGRGRLVVTQSTEPDSIVAGAPARKIGERA